MTFKHQCSTSNGLNKMPGTKADEIRELKRSAETFLKVMKFFKKNECNGKQNKDDLRYDPFIIQIIVKSNWKFINLIFSCRTSDKVFLRFDQSS